MSETKLNYESQIQNKPTLNGFEITGNKTTDDYNIEVKTNNLFDKKVLINSLAQKNWCCISKSPDNLLFDKSKLPTIYDIIYNKYKNVDSQQSDWTQGVSAGHSEIFYNSNTDKFYEVSPKKERYIKVRSNLQNDSGTLYNFPSDFSCMHNDYQSGFDDCLLDCGDFLLLIGSYVAYPNNDYLSYSGIALFNYETCEFKVLKFNFGGSKISAHISGYNIYFKVYDQNYKVHHFYTMPKKFSATVDDITTIAKDIDLTSLCSAHTCQDFLKLGGRYIMTSSNEAGAIIYTDDLTEANKYRKIILNSTNKDILYYTYFYNNYIYFLYTHNQYIVLSKVSPTSWDESDLITPISEYRNKAWNYYKSDVIRGKPYLYGSMLYPTLYLQMEIGYNTRYWSGFTSVNLANGNFGTFTDILGAGYGRNKHLSKMLVKDQTDLFYVWDGETNPYFYYAAKEYTTYTFNDVQYYKASSDTEQFKIVPISNIEQVKTFYNTYGYSPFFVIDTANQKVGLPCENTLWTYLFVGDNYIDEEFPTGTFEPFAKKSEISSQETIIQLKNVSCQDWQSDNTYDDFSYKCVISNDNITENTYAIVNFSQEQAQSGNYASVCLTGDKTLTIYSKLNTSITIPTIILIGA